jgi:hypothetical protein
VHAFTVTDNNLFAGTYGGVYLSTNNGEDWTIKNNGFYFSDVNCLASIGPYVFAGAGFEMIVSKNYGSDWTFQRNGIQDSSIFALQTCGTNIFAGSQMGDIYLSTNYGINWTLVNDGLNSFTNISSLAVSGSYLIAGTLGGGIWIRHLSELVGVSGDVNNIPQKFSLSQNYPNPFNPNTVISYSLPSASNVKLIVYNTLGQEVKTLETGYKTAGNYSVTFNASSLPSGVYFYRLEAGNFTQIKKMMLIK